MHYHYIVYYRKSDDEILLDQDMEVGHDNNMPPTHQPEQQPPQPPVRGPAATPAAAQPLACPCQQCAEAVVARYIYTALLFTKLPMLKITEERTRMNDGWGRGRRRGRGIGRRGNQ